MEKLFSSGLGLGNAFSDRTPLTGNFVGETGIVASTDDFDPLDHISYVIDISGSTSADCDGIRDS